jgi:hypothetical protein
MTESTEKKTVAEQATALSNDVLESVETGQRAATDAVRKFVDSLEEATPALVDPERRKTIINAAVDLADQLVTAHVQFLRSVTRSASEALNK